NPAFRIWSVIYLGLFAFAVYQVLPRHAASPRLRATAWWVLASMVLNAAWIGVVQAGWVPVSVVVIAALLAVNAVVVVRLVRLRPESTAQAVVLDGTLGLYTGWVGVATLAAVAAALADAGGGGLVRLRAAPPARAVVRGGTLGLYAVWVSVATLANVAAALADAGAGELGLGATGWSVVLVAAAAVLSVAWARFTAGRRALAL